MGYWKHGFASETRLTCGRVNSYSVAIHRGVRGPRRTRHPFGAGNSLVSHWTGQGEPHAPRWLAVLSISQGADPVKSGDSVPIPFHSPQSIKAGAQWELHPCFGGYKTTHRASPLSARTFQVQARLGDRHRRRMRSDHPPGEHPPQMEWELLGTEKRGKGYSEEPRLRITSLKMASTNASTA